MNFKTPRIEAGLTQLKASQMLHVERSTVAKWETGQSEPRSSMLPLIAKIYNCEIADLLDAAPSEGSAGQGGVVLCDASE